MARSPRTDSEFRRLYDEHFVAIRSYCLRRLPVSEVNDAVAEVFLVVWRRIDDVPEGEDAPLWLYGIARNVVRNADRSLRRRARLNGRLGPLGALSEPETETLVIRRSEDNEVLEGLANLRSADQEILRLSIWEELSNTEIADMLGIDAHAVTMRLSRARNRLARRLGMERAHGTRAEPQPIGEGGEQ
ncbi:MAG: sigma-70 family RNA polymerase sigma factor [Acidimicrobiia bacterium]|nr:sigma-70 family RNA polymerase sigma factor [Acidimicrobiia bacterium]